ncbi:malto-oligosyltrehalose trehalohydrolase [Tianweitania sediminis]|uniref:Malto-oligosyltrehalose trehalohydrolase n=1 Tax=Tianweitania sediminis TaxID=1502156 RepID=A0A8J7R3Z3_9HYPH|nr:malto-oligosyltrehalose trehalohydrolase [Tianweitania sediminis]MBP0440593.1 malto-oligosyltrehalose trehalohydrolase [Tianweitania sediminis]
MTTNSGKPWGPVWHDDGTVEFRVWAPGTEILSLRLAGNDQPMRRSSDGWFTSTVQDAAPGTPYSFVFPDGFSVPDPASRAQEGEVHGSSLLAKPGTYRWQQPNWNGRPWEEVVYYELHVGTFTPEGTFRAVIDRLPHLVSLGITAIELLPVAQFAGNRGWGYDGVLLYAPHNAYGTPDDLKALIDAAHGHGLMVVLDVVYNHFGPDGNYLPKLAPDFFHPERHTPWGGAIAYEKPEVRSFFIDNALYWLDEFKFDGLRLDAVDHVHDEQSDPEILIEIAQRIRQVFPQRHIHTTTEDNRNITALHERGPRGEIVLHSGEWNDDFHNAAHVIASGETEGYYEDFADKPLKHVARILAEGFAYQGEPAPHNDNKPRGKPSTHLPPTAFVDFLQNHDQVGNRALGERLVSLSDEKTLRALAAVHLLSPHIPLLFMGEEWGETNPFFFFTDFHGELADAVRNGRRKEFAKFAHFRDEEKQKQIPDPNAEATFTRSKIDWNKAGDASWLPFYKELLKLRQEAIVPLLREAKGNSGKIVSDENGILAVDWTFGAKQLSLRANLGSASAKVPAASGTVIFAEPKTAADAATADGTLPPSSMFYAVDG